MLFKLVEPGHFDGWRRCVRTRSSAFGSLYARLRGVRGRPHDGRLIDELREARQDAIVTAATITEERKRLVDFSEPYLEYRLAIAVRRGEAIRGLADLNGRRLAVRVATTAEQFARTRAKAAEIISYHTNVEDLRWPAPAVVRRACLRTL